MGRAITGSVDFHGSPQRWWAHITVPIEASKDGKRRTTRKWVDLERPDLKNTLEDKQVARSLAKLVALAAQKTIHAGHPTKPAKLPGPRLKDFEDLWFDTISRDINSKSLQRYTQSFRALCHSSIGSMPLNKIAPSHLIEWISGRTLRGRSRSTIELDISVLTRFFRDAILNKWIDVFANPVRDDRVRHALRSLQKEYQLLGQTISEREANRLFGSRTDGMVSGVDSDDR